MTTTYGVVRAWPAAAREAARRTLERYGEPDEAMPSRLIWRHAGPWKRVVVHRDPVEHRFPYPHEDRVEGWIDFRVPPERAGDVAALTGSVRVERTRGELAARCDGEPMNFLALNLAHDLVTGRVDVARARAAYTELAAGLLLGRTEPYTRGLAFGPPGPGAAVADEDEPGGGAG
ncbi:hypothetical protein [Phytohabitans rumicis]|uniref:Uncharacterized protein n=1 Tax=Phytohabitans rumicis TaxID=1076125 RepID=A0A6V8LK38_9ACTN|nr:hypothetical protein [Phytohabitans rumicis]GFJ95301.1 hypothetical protein Prum_089430 [Phytohabitans rumicis]